MATNNRTYMKLIHAFGRQAALDIVTAANKNNGSEGTIGDKTAMTIRSRLHNQAAYEEFLIRIKASTAADPPGIVWRALRHARHSARRMGLP